MKQIVLEQVNIYIGKKKMSLHPDFTPSRKTDLRWTKDHQGLWSF